MNNVSRIYVPIGTDCGVAGTLNNNKLRLFSLPFDWVVTYNGVTDIIKSNFKNFLLPDKKSNISCHTLFVHHKFPRDNEMMCRRITRFIDLLKNEEKELVFIRRGHFIHHHGEVEKNGSVLKNDLQDSCDLDRYLKKTYPKLKYKIIVFLCCEKCFEYNKIYSENKESDKVIVFNVAKKTNTIKEKDDIWISKVNEILSKFK